MKLKKLNLTVLPDRYGICRFEPDISVPDWAYKSSFFSVTRTPDELSVVCVEALHSFIFIMPISGVLLGVWFWENLSPLILSSPCC